MNRQPRPTTRSTDATISISSSASGGSRIVSSLTRSLRGPESRRWLEFEATAKAEPILVGFGNFNTYSARDFPGYPGFQGFALRLFDHGTGLWRIWWASTIGRGQLDTPVVGLFRDGEGRFECDDLLGGRAAKVRFNWKDITPSSARWEQSFSFDDARTFETNWIMEFTRMPLD